MGIFGQSTGMKPKSVGEPGAKLSPVDPFFELIEDAYRAFATHKPSDTEVCVDHCMPQPIADAFFSYDVRELPLRYLEEWYSAAASSEGISKHLWTYLTPRILEVLAAGQTVSFLGFEVVFQRYPVGRKEEWSENQWQVLDGFQRRFLAREIASETGKRGNILRDSYLDDKLCMFRRGGWELEDLLNQILAMPIDQLISRLWQDWCEDFGEYGTTWVTEFWEPDDKARMEKFYVSDVLHQRFMGTALSDSSHPDIANKASDLVSVIERTASAM